MKTTLAKGRAMWQCWILMLCATGVSCTLAGPQSFSINPLAHNQVRFSDGIIRRFDCPVGFFRLKRNCYYLSAGTAQWREAYFHCKDRNSTLAVLDKNGKDRNLRKYLMGDQFTKLERWIGGIYNWQRKDWEWGVSGDKIVFKNFEKLKSEKEEQYAWHCIVVDPNVAYKWKPRSCVEKKHYICEVPAGGKGRRRRKRIDPYLAPQNQRQRPKEGRRKGKGKKRDGKPGQKGEGIPRRRNNRVQQAWRREWEKQNKDQPWANGEKPGSRAPTNFRMINGTKIPNRTRHRPRFDQRTTPRITQEKSRSHERGTFLSDGLARAHPMSLSEDTVVINQFPAGMNDIAHEEFVLNL